MATVEFLKRIGVGVTFNAEQTCCGQPAYNAGYHHEAREVARGTLRLFEPRTGLVRLRRRAFGLLRGDDQEMLPETFLRRRGGVRACKSKSMMSEEIDLNHALAMAGVEAVETDFGEFIAQLAGERPSHINMPIVHKSRAATLVARLRGR